MNTLVFTSRHGTPKYFLFTTFFVSSVVAASVFNEVINDVVGFAFVTVGNDDKIELDKVDAVVVLIVGDGDLV